ncbi:MAG: hypothetical protein ACRDLN_14685, partial [Solirubrobacteraceae bacterium]
MSSTLRIASGALAAAAGAALAAAFSLGAFGDQPVSSAAESWRALRDSTLARTEVAAARIGDGAYVVGGFAGPAGATTDVAER